MKYKAINFFTLIFLFFHVPFLYANNDESEQIDLNEIKKEIIETSSDTSDVPSLNSKSAIVLDRTTKSVLFGKNEKEIRKMASTTKIMTAIIVIENANLYDTVIISKKAASTGGSTLGIKEGDKITICDLLYGLLLKSGNDTAVALAENVGGNLENFAKMMNKKAEELNLKNTHFVTPHGLDNENHYTTAFELAILTDYALNNQTFCNFVNTKSYTVAINGIPKNINNTNELLGNIQGVYGVKTGFTNGANRCLVTSCKRDNLDIICVVLGADTKKFRTQDSIKLIEYAYANYKMIDLERIVNEYFSKWKSENINKFHINKGVLNNIDLEIKDFNYKLYPINKKDIDKISTSIECNYNLDAPIKEISSVGSLVVNIGNNIVLKYNIMNINNIEKKSCFYYLKDFLNDYFKYLTIDY